MTTPRRIRQAARAAALVALTALTGLGLAACAGAGHPSPSATALPAGITADLAPVSVGIELDQMKIEIRNTSEDPLEIGVVRVEDPRFDGRAGRVVNHPTTIPAGETGSVRLRLPVIDCDAPNIGAPVVRVGFTLGAASSVAVTPLPDTLDVVSSIYARECGDPVTAGAASAAQ